MGFLGLTWGNKKIAPATYSKDNAGNHIYKLTEHDLGGFRSCFIGGYSEANMIRLFESIPEVFAPVDAIASRVANGIFQLKRLKNDEVVYDNKAWNRLTSRPNFKQNFQRLIYSAVVYKYVCGNRYFYSYVPSTLKKRLDNITSLWLLPPQFTEPIIKSDRPKMFLATEVSDLVKHYKFNFYGDSEELTPDLVYHDTYLSFSQDQTNLLKGIGALRISELPMSNLIAVYQARNVIYVKRGALGFMVGKKEDASGTVALLPKEKDSLREEMQGSYGVTGNRDIIGITDVPVDFVRISMSIEELQPFEETYASAAAIYGTLGVPRSFIPTKDGPTYTNGPADERKLYQDVVIKDGLEICEILNYCFNLAAEGFYCDVTYDHIEILQADKKSQAEIMQIRATTQVLLYEKGHITKNQMLVAIGLEQVAGGDVYITDNKNSDPLAVKIGVGGVTALQGILMSTMDPTTKKNTLVILFGLSEQDASKMVNNESTSEN